MSKKESIEKLDEINCLWVLKQVSLGNLIRALAYLAKALDGIRSCFKETCLQSKVGKNSSVDEQAPDSKKQTQSRTRKRSAKKSR